MTPILRRAAAGAAALVAASALVLSAGVTPADAGPKKAPKKAPATSKLTFDMSSEGSLKVKLASKRAVCFKDRPVFAVIEYSGQDYAFTVAGRTNSKGVFTYPPAIARGVVVDSISLTAFSPRSKRCLPVQSNTVTVTAPTAAKPKKPKKAKVAATLTYNGSKLRVKVTSSRPVCQRNRKVVLLSPSAANPEVGALVGRTNAKGVFTYALEGAPPEPVRLTTFVPRSDKCQLGQSNVLRILPEETSP
ncbi:hypothetical protein FXB39_16635 [Nocardioides sp. BGMRC 2183]|nr:hypothetical protein FXB39_16635 [Nocardioides sp. BGMRC 2183]